MSAWTEQEYQDLMRSRGQAAFAEAKQAKPSKYRNVKIVTEDGKFDSKRELAYWEELKLRQKAGEIHSLKRQVSYDLLVRCDDGSGATASVYLADFTFWEVTANGEPHTFHVVDIKGGKETAMFTLKRKWLFLQSGIEVEVVR